jgi:hypothetical protein
LLASRYGINHIRISGYNSRANGIVESKHFDVREAIMKTCQGVETNWRSVLHQVFWAERVTVRKSTGYSPYYMVHGTHPLLPFDILEATYLAPPQDFGITTEDLIATRARQLAKRPEDIAKLRETVTSDRSKNLRRFERQHGSRIIDFNFKPGSLVLVRNSRVEDALNRKTKPRYLGPMVVVRKTPGTSYVVAELDGAESQLRVAGFRLIPYFPRSRTHTTFPDVPDEDDDTFDDPEDLHYLSSIPPDDCTYRTLSPPPSAQEPYSPPRVASPDPQVPLEDEPVSAFVLGDEPADHPSHTTTEDHPRRITTSPWILDMIARILDDPAPSPSGVQFALGLFQALLERLASLPEEEWNQVILQIAYSYIHSTYHDEPTPDYRTHLYLLQYMVDYLCFHADTPENPRAHRRRRC